ncbi:MAG: hypothetical protein HQL66_05400 [Magnetococcales bacterium]|nr:hypothetical protein [Magnetococcales bacterium]
MKHFQVDNGGVGFLLCHNGRVIAEGLTRDEAFDAADHLERLFYETPVESFGNLVAFQSAVATSGSRIRNQV